MLDRRALLGAVLGTITAGVTIAVADRLGELAVFPVVEVLVIAFIGLLASASAALFAYVAAGVVLVAVGLPAEALSVGDLFRVATFALGTPVVILLLLRAERHQEASKRAQVDSAEAEGRALLEQEGAVAARGEAREAQERAEQERVRVEEIADAAPEPLLVYDDEGRGTYANRAALRMFGRSFHAQSVDDWARQANPRDERGVPLSRDEWPQLRARRGPVQRRMLVRLPMSGREIIVDVEGRPLPDGGCVLLMRDVGREVDERRRLSRFASFVAHELRNPLAVAKARIELATRESAAPRRRRDHEERARQSVDAAIEILERLELFSRAEAGRLEAEQQPFDLVAALDAAIEQLAARGGERPIVRRVPVAATVVGDPHLAQVAIANLLINADRYSKAGGPITVEISEADCRLRVSDAGPGIDDEVAGQLFTERVASGRGLGLGLYLVRAAMDAQGGSVTLEQRKPRAVFALSWEPATVPTTPAAVEAP
jgi:signal transduction histidine kinase